MYTPVDFLSPDPCLQIRAGQAKTKLSQNRSVSERSRVVKELRERGTGALADRMLAMLGDRYEEDGQ
jgi:predicted FMN-binding regulatory protein PaiB